MLRVKRELCVGCGLCASNCPEQAISMLSGQAEIDVNRCRECYTCVQVCPRGAITERVPISPKELQTAVASLKQKTEDIIKRIEKIKQSRPDFNDVANREPV
ncbi:MAG TPA: 4Fe-4S binding protein [Dehalococcoidia bacterium]|nr:4Fe-4S binding protein [Dehalococcoidia bacterium]